ncbi:MAG: MerR family transcriptional regulator [Flavobacteriales bacterium]|nr:MerR family transcriptional regulator [Flavobacteriales bacterium]
MSQYYTIRDLEALSGIKAHTIRIWEKRYSLLDPDRTGTNIRRYDTLQLRKVLNVALLLSNGHKISKVSNFSEEEIAVQVRQLAEGNKVADLSIENQINQLTTAMITFDERAFEKLFSTIILRHGLKDAFVKVLYPFLEKVGLLWCAGEINPAMEHFITNLVRQKLFCAVDGLLNEETDPSRTWLLFLPPGEYHDIGLLMSYFLIKSHGRRVIYLGQDVPYENLASTIDVVQPANILTFFRTGNAPEERSEFLDHILTQFGDRNVYIATDPTRVPENPPQNVHFLHNIDHLVDLF